MFSVNRVCIRFKKSDILFGKLYLNPRGAITDTICLVIDISSSINCMVMFAVNRRGEEDKMIKQHNLELPITRKVWQGNTRLNLEEEF